MGKFKELRGGTISVRTLQCKKANGICLGRHVRARENVGWKRQSKIELSSVEGRWDKRSKGTKGQRGERKGYHG